MKPFENISIADYNYDLPDDRIALFPTGIRDESRLLVCDPDGTLHNDVFGSLATYLPDGSHIFFNNSKVIPARLIFRGTNGSKIEVFCLRPIEPSDYPASLSAKGSCTWECIIGNMRKYKNPVIRQELKLTDRNLVINAEKLEVHQNIAKVKFSWDNHASFAEVLSYAGLTPLPPYIKREVVPVDHERYQTIYSKHEGSVAAPTAGLHFTEDVFRNLELKNIKRHEVTLHVGAGTFQPVKTRLVRDHKMHAEYFEITRTLVEQLASLPAGVTCVGTTTVRTLESIYWLGARLVKDPCTGNMLHLEQWEPYSAGECSLKDSFDAFMSHFDSLKTDRIMASTSFMIVPGYRFRVTERLITNFHQPQSTLLLLIAAFIGKGWKEVYDYALQNDFRFLSYGDSSLLFGSEVSDFA